MRIFLIGLLILAGILPSAAKAGTEPIIAAAPDWVEKVQIPGANPKLSDQPFQLLLFTAQTSHDADASTRYLESASKVQTAEVLTAAGTIAIPWQPERSDLIIHKLEIIREGVSRDVLATQKFSILRRETYLEAAFLDGMLTATIQPEDLRVGDIVHLAYSTRERPGSVGWKAEDRVSLRPGIKSSLALVREIWPDSVPLRWAASPRMGQLKVRKTKFGNELRAEFRNIDVPLPPQSSPARFASPMYLEASAYRDWGEISALLAPLYAKAVTLPENSSLKAEARLIASASATPKARALAALRLVQDKIRYLAVLMDEGGYIPASAEETWKRRFGDCKGKTAALLALLKELGIEAEPVLVNAVAGDVLPARLPQAKLFNHLVVRATIDGKSYWLDGARAGDRDLEELAASSFRHGLPLRSSGATLMALPLAPPLKPLVETKITYDASGGLFVPAKAQGEIIFRGEPATAFRLALARVGEAEFKKGFNLDSFLRGEIDRVVQFKPDPDLGTFTVSFSGHTRMDWTNRWVPMTPRFRFNDTVIRWPAKFEGCEGPNAHVPFQLGFPVHQALREEVILPEQGKGYTLQGKSFDRTVAGTRIARSLILENGRAVATSTFIRLQPELPAAEAQASTSALAEINADEAYIVAPKGLAMPTGDIKPAPSGEPTTAGGPATAGEPTTADEFLARGYHRFDNLRRLAANTDYDLAIKHTKDALADFDRAVELAPGSSIAHATRALPLIELGRLDEAEAAVGKAHSVGNVHPRAFQARGLLHARRGRPEKAIPDFSRYLDDYNPASAMALIERAYAYEQVGELEKAKADLQRALPLAPSKEPLVALARVAARAGNVPEAIALIDKTMPVFDTAATPAWKQSRIRAIRRGRILEKAGRVKEGRAEYEAALREIETRLAQLPAPSGPVVGGETLELLTSKASLLGFLGRPSEAVAIADRILKLQPTNVPMLIERCRAWLYVPGQLAKARQDCDFAKRTEVGNAEALYVSGLISLKAGDWDRAANEFQLLAKHQHVPSVVGLGLAKLRRGDSDGAAYIELARATTPEIDSEFTRFGISTDRDATAADLKRTPSMTLYTWGSDGRPSREPTTADDFLARGYSRLVKQQLNDALADFDRGIELAPESSLALSLRANALTRLGRLDEAEVAINKALTRETVHPRSYQIRGLLRARRGRLAEAIEDLGRDLHPEPPSAIWLVERGLAYEKLGELEKARADLTQAVALLPSRQRRLLLARVTARLGDVKGAIAIVDNAVPELGAANSPPWLKTYMLALRRGRVLSMAGRKEEARAQYDAALSAVDARLNQLPALRGPVLGGVALLKAKVILLLLTDRTTEAIAVADQALAVQPTNAPMLTVRCKAWLHAPDQLAKARQDCDAARRNDPANQDALYASGLTSLKSNDWLRAAGEFEALTKELPEAPAPLFGRGIVKLRRGQKAEGAADIELARSLSAEIEAEFEEIGLKP